MREVSDLEYNEALADPENKRVMHYSSSFYADVLTPSERENCELHGLWVCLRRYEEDRGDFHKYLSLCVQWECKRVSAVSKGSHHTESLDDDEQLTVEDHTSDNYLAYELLSILTPKDRELVTEYYIHGRNYSEIAHLHKCTSQWVKTRITRSLKKMQKKARSGV